VAFLYPECGRIDPILAVFFTASRWRHIPSTFEPPPLGLRFIFSFRSFLAWKLHSMRSLLVPGPAVGGPRLTFAVAIFRFGHYCLFLHQLRTAAIHPVTNSLLSFLFSI
jgi:hypothetical protein